MDIIGSTGFSKSAFLTFFESLLLVSVCRSSTPLERFSLLYEMFAYSCKSGQAPSKNEQKSLRIPNHPVTYTIKI